MIYKIFLIGLLGIFLFESCYDDKGNYSYRAINEITVKHDFFGDTVLRMYSFVDTLRVFPEISTTVNHDPDNYEYEWVAVGGDPTIGGQYTLGKEKDLVYPITLPSQSYSVYFKIQDKIVHYCNIIVYFVESIYVNESIRRNIGRIEKGRKECVSGFFLGVL